MRRYECASCGGTKFAVLQDTYTVVDFGQEGAIKGLPLVAGPLTHFQGVECYTDSCRRRVPYRQAREMYRHVL